MMSTIQRSDDPMEELIAGLFWKKIDPQKYPDGLVMAANFDQGSIYFNERLVGYLYPHLFSEHIGVDFLSTLLLTPSNAS